MLLITVVLASITIAASGSRGATSLAAPAGLPLYQFVDSGTGPLPWNALSLEGSIDHTTMVGAPHGASDATEGVLAYRTNHDQLALFTQTTTGVKTWTNLSTPANSLPAPSSDPIPFFDPSGNVDLLYIDDVSHVILLSQNDPVTPLWRHLREQSAWRPYVATDLSALTGATAANGLASILVNGLSATIAYRTTKSTIEVLQVGWSAGEPIPYMTSTPGSVTVTASPTTPTTTTTKPVTTTTKPVTTTTKPVTTTTKPVTTTTKPGTTTTKPGTTTTKPVTTTTKPVTTTTKPVTTTTLPASSVTVASDPIVIPGPVPTFVTTSNVGDLLVYTASGTTLGSWSVLDVSTLTLAPKIAGTLAMAYSDSAVDVAALTSSGDVELFSSPITSSPSTSAKVVSEPVWSALNVTGAATGAPPLSGSIFVSASPTLISIDGQAANWGDLFSLTSVPGSATWSATDVSATGGSAAKTVGGAVTGVQVGPTLTLFAAGVNSPPPQGVGVYAIPSSKWGQAISDGWPIVSETGGLGTQSSPWVGFTSATTVANSPDFLMGQSIYNSHKRVTWLSFWTVSGPLKGQPQTTTNYYNHGFAAGAWVATQIDQYRSLGVGLKPDWVIFDPEGYPDNHSGLDAPAGSSNATLALYATYWSAMLKGWANGMASIDPNLNAGVYASQSEYRNYDLVTQSMPVFVAVAFGNGGPTPIGGATGSNIRGYISFAASCTPTSTLATEESTLLNPPWSGQFNTLQFNAGVYCAPAAP
ncbi:MAG: hypothetical protein ABSA07_11705 [Acidimicrobiales bacterium]